MNAFEIACTIHCDNFCDSLRRLGLRISSNLYLTLLSSCQTSQLQDLCLQQQQLRLEKRGLNLQVGGISKQKRPGLQLQMRGISKKKKANTKSVAKKKGAPEKKGNRGATKNT
ncbi:hypothetical protein BS78_05G112400 [Paspalum vaginatum]|nr:hypothetical protein BS78_05G112400 [Paspalum vaginatum]